MNDSCLIIIPFVSMNDYLLECLEGCLKLDYKHFHIALLPDVPITLPSQYVSDNLSVIVTGDITIAAKRNFAIRTFKEYDFIALLDSDAYPDADWLKNGTAFLTGHPDVWAVGGPNITPPGEPLLQLVVGNAQRTFLVSGPLSFAKSLSSSRYCVNLHSCNLILPKPALDILEGFDETLFTGEDRNLCDRIRNHGKHIFFHQDVVVYHHNRPLWSPFFLQRLTYGHGSIAISKKERNRHNLALYLPLGWLGLFLTLVTHGIVGESMSMAMAFASLNLAAATIVAARACRYIREIPLTMAAILICYIGTIIGQITALVGITPNLKRIYTNNPPPYAQQHEKIAEPSATRPT